MVSVAVQPLYLLYLLLAEVDELNFVDVGELKVLLYVFLCYFIFLFLEDFLHVTDNLILQLYQLNVLLVCELQVFPDVILCYVILPQQCLHLLLELHILPANLMYVIHVGILEILLDVLLINVCYLHLPLL